MKLEHPSKAEIKAAIPVVLIAIVLAVCAGLAAYKWRGGDYGSKLSNWWQERFNRKGAAVNKAAAGTDGKQEQAGKQGRKILYYRNPMGLPDTSPVPKKDSMGMDYVPVYEDEEALASGEISISTEKVQKLGVRTEAASMKDISRAIRAVGRIDIDERRTHVVAPKFEGWIEKLHVDTSSQPVRAGQALFEAYSPELNLVQKEYHAAAKMSKPSKSADADLHRLGKASLNRLHNLGIDDRDLTHLRAGGEPKRTLTLRSPASGIVIEKKAVRGMRFGAGDTLYQIVDLSSVWVVIDVYEQDITAVKAGQKAIVKFAAYPGREFRARVAYVYPTVNEQTRTTPVRLELSNKRHLFRPGMYADVELLAGARKSKTVAIPVSAVIDSGVRQTVLVAHGEGRFEPREVTLGARNDQYVAVLKGVKKGEQVVVSANFLLDAESNLRAAVAAFGKPEADAGRPAKAPGTKKPRPQQNLPTHHTRGVIERVDVGARELTITHEPIASLNWPAMTMDFRLDEGMNAAKLLPGQQITFDFIEREPGVYVVTGFVAERGTKNGSAAASRKGQ